MTILQPESKLYFLLSDVQYDLENSSGKLLSHTYLGSTSDYQSNLGRSHDITTILTFTDCISESLIWLLRFQVRILRFLRLGKSYTQVLSFLASPLRNVESVDSAFTTMSWVAIANSASR